MKTYRILGILWLALCCYSAFNLLQALVELHRAAVSAWLVLAGFCLMYLLGIVASIFLFRGVNWARWFIVMLAILVMLSGITMMVKYRFTVESSIFCVIGLVSLVLLFLPRHDHAA